MSESNLLHEENSDRVEDDARSQSSRQSRRAKALMAAHLRVGKADQRRMPSMVVVPDDDVSSLGGIEDQTSASPSLMRMALAIKNQGKRPSSLTLDERALWNAVQQALEQARGQDPKQPYVNDDSSVGSTETWESRYNEVQEKAVKQQKDSDRSLRAMQRVLADTTDQRDKALSELKTKAKEALATMWQEEKSRLQEQLMSRKSRVEELENELAAMRCLTANDINTIQEKPASKSETLPSFSMRVDGTGSDGEMAGEGSTETCESSCEMARLRKEVQERTSALESAKMIITSLEHASGSHAAEMRTKLKAREDELSRLKAEAFVRQKRLDSLALELRDAKRAQASRNRSSAAEREKTNGAIARVEKNMADIRAAAAVYEATLDASVAEQVSDLFGDSIAGLRDAVEAVERVDDRSGDVDSVSSCSDSGSRGRRNTNDKHLRRELDEKTASLRRLEEELQVEKEENRRTRSEVDRIHRLHEEKVEKYKLDIQNLRSQYGTIMTVLAKKERELVVLRDSLKVDEDVGYISDDASEADEEEDATPSLAASGTFDTTLYGPSQTEAVATLLSAGIDVSSNGPPGQMEALKCELLQITAEKEQTLKQLKMEKESLANAKMIISSLEKANKSMMEDLRSRLQDSNTAIAALLEKSVGSEKTTAQLRLSLESLKKERDNEKEKYQTEIERLRMGSSHWSTPHKRSQKKVELMITETLD